MIGDQLQGFLTTSESSLTDDQQSLRVGNRGILLRVFDRAFPFPQFPSAYRRMAVSP